MSLVNRINRWLEKPLSEKLNTFIYNYRALKYSIVTRDGNQKILTAHLPWCSMKVRTDWLGKNIFLGSYEKKELLMLASLIQPDWVAFDIGANIGYYTLFLEKKAKCSEVYAFEPSPREYNLLQENLQLNSCNRTKTFALALGESESTLELYMSSENMGKNSFNYFNSSDQHIKVPVKTANSLVESANIRRLDFIKMDVEGAEPMVLKGASEIISRFKPIILYESWEFSKAPYGSFECETTALLEKYGYHIFDIDQRGRLITVRKGDMIHSENALAIHKERIGEFSPFIRN